MFVIFINKVALKIMKKKRNDLVANPIYKLTTFFKPCKKLFQQPMYTCNCIKKLKLPEA